MTDIFALFPTSFSREAAGLVVFGISFAVVGIGGGFLLGRNRLVSVVIGVYASSALTGAVAPLLPKEFFLSEAGIFSVSLVAFAFAGKSLFDIHVPSVPRDLLWRVIATGLVTTGMVTSVLVRLLPKKTVAAFPIPIPTEPFGAPLASFLWMSLPLFFLIILNRRVR